MNQPSKCPPRDASARPTAADPAATEILAACEQLDQHLAELRSAAPGPGAPSHTETLDGDAARAAEQSDTTSMRRAARRPDGSKSTAESYPYLAPPQSPDEIGRLEGYRVLRVLGSGGMGVVFEAHDLTLDRRVAIKVLHAGDDDPSLTSRFLQEARLAGSLASDRVVTVYQVGQQNGVQFIAMELLTGETLEDLLARDHTLPLIDALRIGAEVAEGLAAAHEKHLIHRDIKPANVWLRRRQANEAYPHVKLLDFGIAKPLDLPQGKRANLTLAGRIVGTPNYMSPEQACGEDLDERSDLFSLGCLLYAMLAGQSPFERTNPWSSLHAVANEAPESLASKLPLLPRPVVQLVDQLLNKDREQRPASARQVAETLRRLQLSTSSGGMALTSLTDSEVYNREPAPAWTRRIGWGVWVGAMVVTAAAAFGAWGAWNSFRNLKHHDGAAAPGIAALAPESEAEPAAAAAGDALPPIKVGVLHSLSGPMAVSERPLVDGFLFAIEELNKKGGVLRRRIEPIVRDGQSNEDVFAEQAEKLITEDHVVSIFGCWRSGCRKVVEDVCAKHKNLLIYPARYEGVEQSPYVVYMGGSPNQQMLPAVKWAFAFLDKRRFFLIGVDGIYSRTVTEIVKDEIESLGGEVVGIDYRVLGDTDFASAAVKMRESGADMVINSVSGIGQSGLFRCMRAKGVDHTKVPVLSFRLTEEELRMIAIEPEVLAGNFAVCSYFQSLNSDFNRDFVARFRKRFGETRVVTDPIAAAYAGTHVWATAVNDANSDDVNEIRKHIAGQRVEAPEGVVTIDNNQHAVRTALIGQVTPELEFEVIWSSPKPIVPEPYPKSRTPEAWHAFQQELYRSWGNAWRPGIVPREPR